MKLYGLVRDKNGKPKIDDPSKVRPQIAAMMTAEERAEFNIPEPPQEMIEAYRNHRKGA